MKKIYTSFFLLAATFSFAQTGLVSSYPFNGNANDVAGTNNATVNGATLTTDRFGNANSAYSFDGINDYIRLNSPFDLAQRTVSFWAYISNADIVPQGIFTSDNNALQNGNTNFEIDKYSLNILQFGMSVGGNTAVSSTNINQWYHIASTWDGTTAKFYINGSLVSSGTNTNNAKSNTGESSALLGCGRNLTKYFNGKIDDVMIFNRALTEAEISGITSIDDALNPLVDFKAYYNSGSKNIVIDFSEFDSNDAKVSVFNAFGQLVYRADFDGAKHSIPVASTGVYIVSLSENSKNFSSRKVVVY